MEILENMTETIKSIEEELVEATGTTKEESESRNKYLSRLLRACSKLPDEIWESLSNEAQQWVNDGIEAMTSKLDIPEFPGSEAGTFGGEGEDPEEIAAEVTDEPEEVEEVLAEAEPEPILAPPVKRGPGRPRKSPLLQQPAPTAQVAEAPVKRKRGRPRKNPLPEQSVQQPKQEIVVQEPVKRKRGRPPKVVAPQPVEELPKTGPRAAPPEQEELDTADTNNVLIFNRSRDRSTTGGPEFYRELVLAHPNLTRDQLRAHCVKQGYEIQPGTANSIYYEARKLLELLQRKKMLRLPPKGN
jgi:hypothetical protein